MSETKGKKIRFSIVYKLNTKLVLRLLALLLTLDFFFFAASGVFFLVHAEQKLVTVNEQIEDNGLPSARDESWLTLTDVQITPLEGEPEGLQIIWALRPLFPESTRNGWRWLETEEFQYQYTQIPDDLNLSSPSYRVTLSLQPMILLLKQIFLVFAIGELVLLLGSISSGARMIRSTLQPISDLAEVAQSLNTESTSFSIDKMERLADKLASINAARLDTRISVDETQDELKGLADAINGLLDRINESYRSQVRFVSDASHELRTPISVIQGYANLLDRWGKNDPKTLQESIDAIKEETNNMKGLVEQLLFLARGDNDTMPLQLEDFPLAELAEEVLRETRMIDTGHEFVSNLEPLSVYADRALVKQALRILVDNAIQYTNPGGEIRISIQNSESFARLTVQDNGIGIPGEAVSRVFDRFYRTDESRTRASGGTGLGLSIAKWIAERHGGHMEVLSRQNVGTRISVVLPVADHAITT